MPIDCQRPLFDVPRDVCYLNASYMTPLLNSQVEVGRSALELNSHPWAIGSQDFFASADEVRRQGAALMNAKPEEVAIVPSASYGIATAAKNLRVSEGGAIVVMAEEFPSNHYAWQAKAMDAGAELLAVPIPHDDNWTQAIVDLLEREGTRVEIVSLANLHWSSGAALDLVKISAVCKRIGAALVLDLSQSLGAMPTDIKAIDPDFMVSAGYKWLLAPYGISLMYAAPRQCQGTPLEEGWITREGSENFSALVNYQYKFQPGAQRFEMGERANLVLAPIFAEGLRQLNEWGVDRVYRSLGEITDRLAHIVEAHNLRPIAREFRTAHILGVHVGANGPGILARLQEHGVFASLRGEMLRLAPHLWVDDGDIERFKYAIDQAVPK